MPADVIERVQALARKSKSVSGLTFGWRDGFRIVDDNKDEDHDDRMEDPDYNPADDGSAHNAVDKDDYEYNTAAYYNNVDPIDDRSKANHVPIVGVVEADEYEDKADKSPHNNQKQPEDPLLKDGHNSVEQYKDDAHHEQDLVPCIIDAESINEYDNEYENADNAQEWDQPP